MLPFMKGTIFLGVLGLATAARLFFNSVAKTVLYSVASKSGACFNLHEKLIINTDVGTLIQCRP